MGTEFNLLFAAGAFLIAVTLPGVLRPVLERAGMIDIPNARSSHNSTAIRGVGLAPATTLVLSLLIFLVLGHSDRPLVFAGACIAILGASVVGAVEDSRGIASKYRALLQIIVGTCGTLVILWGLDVSFWWLPFGSIVIATYINVANFMDGINGISGGHGLFVGLHYVVIGLISNIQLLTVLGMLLAAVFLAFLPWNLIHGKMFLGDVGSYLLGSSIGIVSITALIQGVHPVAVLGPVAIYLSDTGITLLHRVRNGENWSEAHRSHVYQLLTSDHRAHWKVSLLVSALGAATGGAGLLAVWNPIAGWALGLPLIVLVCIAYMALPELAYRRRRTTNVSGRVIQ